MAAPGQRVSGARDQVDRMIGGQRHHFEVRLAMQRARLGDEEVELAAAQLAGKFVPVAGMHLDADSRKLLDKPGGCAPQYRVGRVRPAADGNATRPQVAVADGFPVEFVGHPQDVARPLDIQAPEVGGHGTAARTQEQVAAEAPLEVLDAARQRRLADVQRCSRAHEAAVLGQREHLSQLLQLEGHAKIIYARC